MQPYIPQKLPLEKLDWARFVSLIGKANYELARYAGILKGIVNPDLLLSPLTLKEAVISSRIEGTQATLEDVLRYEASAKKDVKNLEDIQEVINYRKALDHAVDYLKERPTCLNLCREIHFILLDSVRGKDKARGEFRKIQNWIGSGGANIEQASYVPPPPERMMELLSNLESYFHFEEKDRLVQLAIIHAQFELVHPFLDGNGRVGRILMPLLLMEWGLLNAPVFYISEYIDNTRNNYYDLLKAISEKQDWESWIIYFLTVIVAQAKTNTRKTEAILDLYNEMKVELDSLLRSKYTLKVLDTIFMKPYFNTNDFVENSNIPKRTAINIINALAGASILSIEKKGSGTSPSAVRFTGLLDIVK